jgi:hypothetical protein
MKSLNTISIELKETNHPDSYQLNKIVFVNMIKRIWDNNDLSHEEKIALELVANLINEKYN